MSDNTSVDAATNGSSATDTSTDSNSGVDPDTGMDVTALQSVLNDLGITPDQIKTRLEASRKWEDRAKEKSPWIKELQAKAARLDELEESQKSDQQKLADAKALAETDAAAARAELARMQAAVTHGLTADDLELLGTHGTPEEIEQRAERLASRLKAASVARPADFGGGDRGSDVGSGVQQLSQEAVKAMTPDQIVEAKAKGQLNDYLGIKA